MEGGGQVTYLSPGLKKIKKQGNIPYTNIKNYNYFLIILLSSILQVGWLVGWLVGWFIPVAPIWSIGHTRNSSFHFSFLI
jgi:hypothetical protein